MQGHVHAKMGRGAWSGWNLGNDTEWIPASVLLSLHLRFGILDKRDEAAMRSTKYAIALVGCILFNAPALAETARTVAGKEVRLRVSFACSLGDVPRYAAPLYHVSKQPDHGKIVFRDEKPGNNRVCPKSGAPAKVARSAYYRPDPGFRGTDTATLEWQSGGGGRRRGPSVYPYTITVE